NPHLIDGRDPSYRLRNPNPPSTPQPKTTTRSIIRPLAAPAPREGLRPRRGHTPRPQRQGAHHGLRAGLQRPAPPAPPAPRADHARLHGGAGGPAMGLPQQPGRPLLPELRGDRRAGALLPRYGVRASGSTS